MGRWLIRFELHHSLLLFIHQPPLAAILGGIVLVKGAFLEHDNNLKRLPSALWWRLS